MEIRKHVGKCIDDEFETKRISKQIKGIKGLLAKMCALKGSQSVTVNNETAGLAVFLHIDCCFNSFHKEKIIESI